MITSEVQRTLVKSPPELWAELSDPTSLARHLGELGEIRITRVDPEQAPAHITPPKPVTGLASWAAAFGAERSGSTKPAPKARVESDIAPVATGEHDRDLPEARAEQELPPRGLFAWLFRRRRGYAQTETNLPAAARTPA